MYIFIYFDLFIVKTIYCLGSLAGIILFRCEYDPRVTMRKVIRKPFAMPFAKPFAEPCVH